MIRTPFLAQLVSKLNNFQILNPTLAACLPGHADGVPERSERPGLKKLRALFVSIFFLAFRLYVKSRRSWGKPACQVAEDGACRWPDLGM
jgi:hypothetical protein